MKHSVAMNTGNVTAVSLLYASLTKLCLSINSVTHSQIQTLPQSAEGTLSKVPHFEKGRLLERSPNYWKVLILCQRSWQEKYQIAWQMQQIYK